MMSLLGTRELRDPITEPLLSPRVPLDISRGQSSLRPVTALTEAARLLRDLGFVYPLSKANRGIDFQGDGSMPYQRYSVVQHKLELRCKALAANIEEIPQLALPLSTLDELLALLKELTAEQARLTAARQEVSKRIAEIIDKAQRLLTYVDLAVKEHYGNRSEKIVEYGLQPFRSKPRIRRVGPDGKPLKGKGKAADAETTATLETE
jgi:hypothetical protein